ncbi:MAG TPA: DUF1571 domain-containing protein [Pirellulales bacterium]|jgi:hypothetical protein|nr:DUF1571 domain-containing protein [Pirellulales bacterium]
MKKSSGMVSWSRAAAKRLASVGIVLACASAAFAQSSVYAPGAPQPATRFVAPGQPSQPVPRRGIPDRQVRPAQHLEDAPAKVASVPAHAPAAGQDLVTLLTPVAGEHPLMPAIRWAKGRLVEIDKIQDYSATLVKRERIDGTLGEHEYIFAKVRHEPFSVYLYFLGPVKVKGQECLYVKGQNEGNLLGHANGLRHKLLGTVSLDPLGSFAMTGNRHPVTELGVRHLAARLIEVGEHDTKFGECEVKTIPNAKVNGRDCTCLQVVHPTPRKDFLFHIARIYIDNELNLPIRHEAYDWPIEAGAQPLLVEEYTYLNLKLNNGFTDVDFDVANPNYQFK